MINYHIIGKVIGIIIFFVGILMLVPTFLTFYANSPDAKGIAICSLGSVCLGFLLYRFTQSRSANVGKREGYLIVVLGWVCTAIFWSLPYLLSPTSLSISFTDALFESVSGLTTTGATIFPDIESLPDAIQLWRSLSQWIGGMGIIVLTVAIFPLLGIGGVELFVAEAPGPTSNKIHPRIKETAKRLWFLYLGLTLVLIVILRLEGMTFFDAFNHGLTTIATGGFSTKNNSIAYFASPVIQYTILLFMFIAGINYSLIYAGIKGRFSKFWNSDEFKTYLIFVVSLIIAVTIVQNNYTGQTFEESFRSVAFQIVSIVTTTGFITADYTLWHPSLTLLFFSLLFAGACAGSTAGGIKFIRHLVFAKNSLLEFKRLIHPNALIRLRIDNKLVAPRILTHVLVFLLLYLSIFLIATFAMTFILADFEDPLLSAAGAVATSLGNVGPAIGQFGPMDNFEAVPVVGKWLLFFVMLLGRLELFSVLILFSRSFWRTN